MGAYWNDMLEAGVLNKWGLFWLVSGPVCVALVVAMTVKDLTTGPGVSEMIQLSVRCAVPWLYVAFAASAIQALLPGKFSRWLLRNRKYFGLCFAAAMAWQAFFILWMVIVHTDYYVNEVYVLRDVIEGVAGYVFLLAMTVTSFSRGRRRLRPHRWRMLHLSGIYFLWAYAFRYYWWLLFYYPNPGALDYIYYWAGLAAWGARAAAWARKSAMAAAKSSGAPTTRPLARLAAGLLVGAGVVAAGLGSAWQGTAEEILYGYALTQIPELYLPYWPFEPFLSLAVITLGVHLLRSGGRAGGQSAGVDRGPGGAASA